MKGTFITIEGTDGTGKSTQIALLAEFLRQKGLPVVLTREPGGTPIGEKIRQILLDVENGDMTPSTEALLYAASRAQHVSQTIRPALEAGAVVICDRFYDSSVVYQAYGRGLGEAMVQSINQWALDGLEPDCTLLFTLPPKRHWIGQARTIPRTDWNKKGCLFKRRSMKPIRLWPRLRPIAWWPWMRPSRWKRWQRTCSKPFGAG